MQPEIFGQMRLCYIDQFGLDVAAEISHNADPHYRHDFGTFDTEQDKYELAVQAAKTMVETEKPFMLFLEFGEKTEHSQNHFDGISIHFDPKDQYNGLRMEIMNDYEPLFCETCPPKAEAAQKAIDLAYGKFLHDSQVYEQHPLSFFEPQQKALKAFQVLPGLTSGIQSLFEKYAQGPFLHFANIEFPMEDLRRLQDLTTKTWAAVCEEYGLSPDDEFPLRRYIEMDDGYKIGVGITAPSISSTCALAFSLISPGDEIVATEIQKDPVDLFLNHKFSFGKDIYELIITPGSDRQHTQSEYPDFIPGLTPEWCDQIIEAAGNAYAKLGAKYHWEAEDAMIWAMENAVTGPHDLPYDVYNQLLSDVEGRCSQVRGTLDFRLAQIKESMQQSAAGKEQIEQTFSGR